MRPTHLKVHGWYSVRFSCSPTSTNYIYTTKLLLHSQIYNETSTNFRLKFRTSPDLVMDFESAHFVDSLTEYITLPIVFTVKCRAIDHVQRRSPISFRHVSLWCLLLDPHRTTYQSKYKGPIKKRNQMTPAHLRLKQSSSSSSSSSFLSL